MLDYKEVSTSSDVLRLIQSFSEEFSTLANRVELSEYATKLAEKASVIAMRNAGGYIGMAAVYMNDMSTRVAYISLIGIKNKYQRMGYGKKLLRYCIESAKKKGMKTIRLEVDNTNEKAKAFYFYNGFVMEKESSRNSAFLVKEVL